jgi:hypothetical protein
MKKDKFFENPVQKKSSVSQFFGNLNIGRKGSDPGVITLPKNNEKPKFSIGSMMKRDILQSTEDDLERELRATTSLVPEKDFEAPIARQTSVFHALVSPRNIFANRRLSHSDPSIKTYSPRPSPKLSPKPTSLPLLKDGQKLHKLREVYETLTPQQVVKEERKRFQLKMEFSPMLIIQSMRCGMSIVKDVEVVQIVHLDDMK